MKPKQTVKKAGSIVSFVLGAAVAVYGLTVFLHRELLTYMFLRTEFVFLDFSSPIYFFTWII